MSREELERARDNLNIGDIVTIVKNSWHRPNTIGKQGVIVHNPSDQLTPNINVLVVGRKFPLTFSPDDVELLERAAQ